jgi:hypothetical protein
VEGRGNGCRLVGVVKALLTFPLSSADGWCRTRVRAAPALEGKTEPCPEFRFGAADKPWVPFCDDIDPEETEDPLGLTGNVVEGRSGAARRNFCGLKLWPRNGGSLDPKVEVEAVEISCVERRCERNGLGGGSMLVFTLAFIVGSRCSSILLSLVGEDRGDESGELEDCLGREVGLSGNTEDIRRRRIGVTVVECRPWVLGRARDLRLRGGGAWGA